MLTRDAILGFKDDRIGRVEVPELGGEVCIASLTAAEADKIRTLGEDGVPMSVGVVILGACDKNGKRLFTMKDAARVGELPASAVGRIAQAILRHNKLGGEDQEEAKNG